MSRIGNRILTIPAGVEVTIAGNKITTKGPKGTLEFNFKNDNVDVSNIPFTLFISINKYFSFNGYYFLVLIYSMVLTLMLSKSFSLITLEIHNKSAIYSLIISTLMFSLSDFILLFILFSPYSSSILMLLNLFTYYIGQGILALNFNKLH